MNDLLQTEFFSLFHEPDADKKEKTKYNKYYKIYYYICREFKNRKVMITRTYTTTTKEVTQNEIWTLITDVNNWSKWDKGTEFSEIKGDFIAGNIFTLKPVGAGKIQIEITDVNPKSYYCDLTKFPLAKMYDEHFYEVTPEGLKITITLTMKGILNFLWYKLVMKDIFENMENDINVQIKTIIDGRK